MENSIRAAAPRRGFTMIEMLVVAAIVIIGIALALPAVQYSRAQARQNICKNNMKMLAIALHNYHDTYKGFPPGWVAHVPTAGNGARVGWQTFILPQLDHAPLYKRFDFESPMPKADANVNGMKLYQTVIKEYRCPADSTSATNPMRGDYGTSNYSGNHGNIPLPRWAAGRRTAHWPGQADTPKDANGVMYYNSSVRVARHDRRAIEYLSRGGTLGDECRGDLAGRGLQRVRKRRRHRLQPRIAFEQITHILFQRARGRGELRDGRAAASFHSERHRFQILGHGRAGSLPAALQPPRPPASRRLLKTWG